MNNQPKKKTEKNSVPRPKRTVKAGKGNGCPLYKKCGGCQLQNMTYEQQLSFKQAKAIKTLGRFGHVDEIIGMEKPYHYRNKVQAAFGTTRGGKIISGVYQSSSHNIVLVDECRLEDKTADKIIVDIRNMLPGFRLTAYNEDTGKGFLRHILVKRSFATKETMVVLVTGHHLFPAKKDFLKKLLSLHSEITTVIWNINGGKTSLVLGDREEILYGNGYIEDILCGKRFRISAKSFYQINPTQTEKLYSTAIDFAELKGDETVLDAYCGTGTIGIVASDKAKQVIGVELNKDAVKDAIFNAKLNNTQNIRFFCADAGTFMVEAAKEKEKIEKSETKLEKERCVKSKNKLKKERFEKSENKPETEQIKRTEIKAEKETYSGTESKYPKETFQKKKKPYYQKEKRGYQKSESKYKINDNRLAEKEENYENI